MSQDLPQFVTQEVCLSCDGCCRFSDTKSAWRPKVARDEGDDRVRQETGGDGYLNAVERQGQAYCVFFQAEDNTCDVYGQRPFECRLYPFLLMKKGDDVAVGVHLSCPHVQSKRHDKSFEDSAESLQKYFQQPEVVEFIQKNPDLAGDYSAYEQEVEYLFPLTK